MKQQFGTFANLPRIAQAMPPGPLQIYESKWPESLEAGGVEVAPGVIAYNVPPASHEHDWIVDAPAKKKAK